MSEWVFLTKKLKPSAINRSGILECIAIAVNAAGGGRKRYQRFYRASDRSERPQL